MGKDIEERCPPDVVDKTIGEAFDSLLMAGGFEKATPRKYVRARVPHTFDIFELHSDLAGLLPIWGLSLSFVPHVAGRLTETVKWHRTPRSTNPDLRYSEVQDVRDFRPQYGIPILRGKDTMQKAASRAASVLFPRALRFFESVPNLLAIESLFVAEEQHPQWGDIFNTPQVALAYAFYLARIGKESKARAYMSEWLKRSHYRAETNERLSTLFEEAVRQPLML